MGQGQANEHGLPGRRVAVDILNRCRPETQFVAPLLESQRRRTFEGPRCTDLVLGVLRRRGTLDLIITQLAQRALRSIDKTVLNILRVAVYELTCCPTMPSHAIVHEAVETAKRVGKKRSAGFVNAVLRQVTRHLVERDGSVDAEALPSLVINADRACRFDVDLWDDPKTALPDYLHQAFHLPKWLVLSWIQAYGADAATAIARASNRRPSLYLRPNPLRCSLDKLTEQFRTAGLEDISAEAGMLRLHGSGGIEALPGYAEGWFSVQDRTASAPAHLLQPQAGERILDLCAAPGGKTTQLAELSGNQAIIVATDIQAQRLERVRVNTQRLGLSAIQVEPYEHFTPEAPSGEPFDAVLLDVPCSNTGVLAKRVEVRYRLRVAGMRQVIQTQRDILTQALSLVRPGGRLCYSTCSIQSEENQAQVQWFLKQNKDFTCQAEEVTLPCAEENDCDGGYAALLVREG